MVYFKYSYKKKACVTSDSIVFVFKKKVQEN